MSEPAYSTAAAALESCADRLDARLIARDTTLASVIRLAARSLVEQVEALTKERDEASRFAERFGAAAECRLLERDAALTQVEAQQARIAELEGLIREERRWATGTAEHNDARSALYHALTTSPAHQPGAPSSPSKPGREGT